MPDDKDQRTEQATPRWRQEQRRKGKVATSRDVNSAVLTLCGIILLYFTGPSAGQTLLDLMRNAMSDNILRDWSSVSMLAHVADITAKAGYAIAPAFIGMFVVVGIAAYGQVGFVLTTEPLGPNIDRLNPIAGMGRLISMKSFFKLGTSLAKIAVVGTAIYLYLSGKVAELPVLAQMTAGRLTVYICESMLTLAGMIALVLFIIAAIDYGFQRYQYEKDVRMTPQQVKEEMKRAEGDPLVKARVRQIQREMARGRMMQDVPDADVIIRNPTMFAVALKYDQLKMGAPTVVAKGMNEIARKIIEIAEANGVPTVENKPLARELHRTVEIGGEIPGKLYKAVAEVLSYIYRLRGRKVPA